MRKLFYSLLTIASLMCTSCQASTPVNALKGKRILFVYGGWEGHEPRQTMEKLKPWLESEGAMVVYRTDLDAYADKQLMGSIDLVIQTWTMGTLTSEQERGLLEAVRNGTEDYAMPSETIPTTSSWWVVNGWRILEEK